MVATSASPLDKGIKWPGEPCSELVAVRAARVQYGEIVDVNLVRDRDTGKSRVRVLRSPPPCHPPRRHPSLRRTARLNTTLITHCSVWISSPQYGGSEA